MRLNAFLARAGVASRRGADELIKAGRVTVDGEPAELATRVGPGSRVEVDGRRVELEPLTYVLLHKPAGVVTTARDPRGRPTVVGLVGHRRRIVPVGRLDADTTGALLLTNDGPLAHRLAHPRYGVEKVYEAEVEGVPSPQALRRLAEGVDLEDGRTAPARARLVRRRRGAATVELALHEGRKRQVKRMLAAVGHPVRRLHRSRYAGLGLAGLAPGEWRELTPAEVEALWALVRGRACRAAGSRRGQTRVRPGSDPGAGLVTHAGADRDARDRSGSGPARPPGGEDCAESSRGARGTHRGV